MRKYKNKNYILSFFCDFLQNKAQKRAYFYKIFFFLSLSIPYMFPKFWHLNSRLPVY